MGDHGAPRVADEDPGGVEELLGGLGDRVAGDAVVGRDLSRWLGWWSTTLTPPSWIAAAEMSLKRSSAIVSCWLPVLKSSATAPKAGLLQATAAKNLVVPRFLALMLVTGLFDIYALLFGIFGGVLATLVNHAPLGPFFATLANNAEPTDLWASVVETTLFGAIIAIVCCFKGMNASGGPVGVGRAVNQAVVIAFLGIFAFNYTFTQVLLATHPAITTIAR